MTQPKQIPFAPVLEKVLREAEKELGFSMPTLLRACYLSIGNGGFGPGLGLIGLEGGYTSDHGTLVEAYLSLKSAMPNWKNGLLPFCEWGCNMYSCVDCTDPAQRIYFLEEGKVDRNRSYTLTEFFQSWINGKVLFPQQAERYEEREIINPFTKQRSTVRRPTS
jgi:hypothetical protein